MPFADLGQLARMLDGIVGELHRHAEQSDAEPRSPDEGPSAADLVRRGSRVLAACPRRAAVFGTESAAARDPGCNMLVYLYLAAQRLRTVAVSELHSVCGLSPTTALRWLDTLVGEKLVERRADPKDGRRIHLSLTARGQALVVDYLRRTPD